MSEQEKNDKESMICLTPKPSQSFFVYHIQSKGIFFYRKRVFLRKRESEESYKKRKKGFLTALAMVIKTDPHKVNKKLCQWIESPWKKLWRQQLNKI